MVEPAQHGLIRAWLWDCADIDPPSRAQCARDGVAASKTGYWTRQWLVSGADGLGETCGRWSRVEHGRGEILATAIKDVAVSHISAAIRISLRRLAWDRAQP